MVQTPYFFRTFGIIMMRLLHLPLPNFICLKWCKLPTFFRTFVHSNNYNRL